MLPSLEQNLKMMWACLTTFLITFQISKSPFLCSGCFWSWKNSSNLMFSLLTRSLMLSMTSYDYVCIRIATPQYLQGQGLPGWRFLVTVTGSARVLKYIFSALNFLGVTSVFCLSELKDLEYFVLFFMCACACLCVVCFMYGCVSVCSTCL